MSGYIGPTAERMITESAVLGLAALEHPEVAGNDRRARNEFVRILVAIGLDPELELLRDYEGVVQGAVADLNGLH